MDERHRESREYWNGRASDWSQESERVWQASHHISEWLIDRLDPKESDTILELACGAGATGLLAAERIGPDGTLISTDFARGMVGVARRHAQAAGIANSHFMVMDAEKLALKDSSVDGVICRWGLMLMLEPEVIVAEVRRVLRRGERFVFSVWGSPADNRWGSIVGDVLEPRGLTSSSDPFGPGGMSSLSDRSSIDQLLVSAGLHIDDFAEISLVWKYDDFDHYWRTISTSASQLGTALEKVSAKESQDLRHEIEWAVSEFTQPSGRLALPGLAINVASS